MSYNVLNVLVAMLHYFNWMCVVQMARRGPSTSNPILPANEIAHAIQRMVNAIQQQTPNNAPRNQISLNNFMRHNPAMFNGKATPYEVDAWI